MSDISAADVSHLAKLARVRLTPEEEQEFTSELPKILDFVEQLRQVKLGKNLPETAAVKLEDLRADEVSGKRLSVGELEKLAPEWRDGQNVVPAVFGEAVDEG